MGRFDPMAPPPRMAATCAKETAGVDVKRTLKIARVTLNIGRRNADHERQEANNSRWLITTTQKSSAASRIT
jgi:hypothetical protein